MVPRFDSHASSMVLQFDSHSSSVVLQFDSHSSSVVRRFDTVILLLWCCTALLDVSVNALLGSMNEALFPGMLICCYYELL
jgi:hypothetical protein